MVSPPDPTPLNTTAHQMQLCQWIYGEGEEGSWRVVAWVFMEPVRRPPGFVAEVRFEAWVERLGAMVDDGHEGLRRAYSRPQVERLEHMQSLLPGLLAAGKDPLLEACRLDSARLAELSSAAPELAAAYGRIILADASGAASAKSSGPLRM